jgi:hypothetical protein
MNTPFVGFLLPFPSKDLGKEEFIKADKELMTMSDTSEAIAVVVGRDIKASRCGSVMQE